MFKPCVLGQELDYVGIAMEGGWVAVPRAPGDDQPMLAAARAAAAGIGIGTYISHVGLIGALLGPFVCQTHTPELCVARGFDVFPVSRACVLCMCTSHVCFAPHT